MLEERRPTGGNMGRIVFTNGKVFDGDQVLPDDTTVVVDGNTILSVGATASHQPDDEIVEEGPAGFAATEVAEQSHR